MRKLLNINIIFFTLLISFNATAQTEMGKVCKTFKGDEGIIVTTARYGPDKNNEVLIGIYDIDHSWDEKIFKAKVNDKADYEISYKGQPYIIMTLRNSNYEIYLPKESNTQKAQLYVYYSEELSDNCTPNKFLKESEEQNKSKK